MGKIIRKVDGIICDMYVDYIQYVPPNIQALLSIGVIFCLMIMTYLVAK